MPDLLQRLQEHRPVLLDGATGTELNRRGVETSLPLWSARALWEAPEILEQIHRDYINAGAELLTANTFRTSRRTLSRAGMGEQAAELTALAVRIARDAAEGKAFVLGSQPPLEDCYRPDLVPEDNQLADEHAEQAAHLCRAGVDGILVETHNTIREAVAATEAATQTGLPVLVSFVCGSDGRLLSGETLSAAAFAVASFQPASLGVNCVPADDVLLLLQELRDTLPEMPLMAYANIGRADPVSGWINTDAQNPDRYAEYAETWLKFGTRIVGGCCGTTPAHIRAVARRIDCFNGRSKP